MDNDQPPLTRNHHKRKNDDAVVSFVTSLMTFFFIWIVPVVGMAGSIIGIVHGYKGVEQTKDAYNSGAGLAKTGIIVGYVSLAISFLWTGFWNYWWLVFLSEAKM